ncbi:hypothetical protein D9M68_793460 [compost metagenome]
MRCLARQQLKEPMCPNGKCIPKGVFDYILSVTSFPFILQAKREQSLTVNQKRIIEIQGELETLDNKARRLAKAIAELDDMDALIEQLQDVKTQQDALQGELLVLERTVETRDDYLEASVTMDMAFDLENDPERLNALLKGVGFTITVSGEGDILHGDRHWKYQGIDRRSGNLKLWSCTEGRETLLTKEGKPATTGKQMEEVIATARHYSRALK